MAVPGFVDGLVSLHERFGTLPLAELLAPARQLAVCGFPVSPTLAAASVELAPRERMMAFGGPDPLARGRRVLAHGLSEALDAVAVPGRAGFYEGAVGDELLAAGAGEFTADDLRTQARRLGGTAAATRVRTHLVGGPAPSAPFRCCH